MSEKNINLNFNLYHQSGNFGAGHVSDGEIKGQAKLGGAINETKESTDATQQLIKSKKTTKDKQEEKPLYKIVIEGKVAEIDYLTIEKIRQKCSEFNLKIVEVREGSIEIILEGSEEDIERFKALIQSGEVTELSGKKIENVRPIDSRSEEELRNKVNTRNQLVQEIRSQNIRARNLEQSDLKFCDLKNIFLEEANLKEANLSFAYLYSADLIDANLNGAYMNSANLSGTNLSDANLSFADLSGAILSGANLIDVNLNGANLSAAYLNRAKLNDANLSGANLNGAELIDANLDGANLSDADLDGANLSGTDLRNTIISEKTKLTSKWRKVWEIINQNANGEDLSGEDLSNAYLRYSSLIEAKLVQANLNNSRLFNAKLTGANLIGADLRNAELLNADLTDADLSGAKVENARFGYNQGISEMMKRDLESRGAIFEDSPPDKPSKVYSPTPSPVK